MCRRARRQILGDEEQVLGERRAGRHHIERTAGERKESVRLKRLVVGTKEPG
jgi:hypothetical protein